MASWIPPERWERLIAAQREQRKQRDAIELRDELAESGVCEDGNISDADVPSGVVVPSAMSTKAFDDCNWVTMDNGAHICIDEDGGVEIGPDGINMPIKDDISQHPDIFHNLTSDPTKQDRADLIQYFKDVATFKLRDDSLLKRAFKELTFDPTKDDRSKLLEVVGENITLKPVRDLLTRKGMGENPAMTDLKELTAGARKVVGVTVGTMVKLLKWQLKHSRETGPEIPKKITNQSVPMAFKSYDPKSSDMSEDDIVDEVMKRCSKDMSPDAIQKAIMDVFEEILQAGVQR